MNTLFEYSAMLRLILSVIAGMAPSGLFAQPRVAAVSQKFQIMPSHLPAGEVLDSTYLVASYRYVYPSDNFKGGFDLLDDELTLQVAADRSKTFSRNLHQLDRNLTYKERNPVRFRLDYADFEVFNLAGDSATIVQRRIPYSRILQPNTQVVEYREQHRPIEWAVSDARDTIAGYPCMRATAVVAGRSWTVWYAIELPVAANLWRFYGLPGLILKAEDADRLFLFECTSVSAVRVPIYRYDWHPVRMSKEQWLRLERRMHDRPADYFLKNGEIKVLDIQTRQPLEEPWKVGCYPLELE